MSKSTIQFYITYLTPLLDSFDGHISDVSNRDLAKFLDSLSSSPEDYHAYFRAIRAFYRWTEEEGNEGYIDVIPKMKAPKVPKPLRYVIKIEDIARLLAAASNARDKLIISMLADTGLRRLELASINKADIDTGRQIIKVLGKGERERIVSYGPYTHRLLLHWLQESRQGNKLFNLNAWGLGEMLQRLERRTGIKCDAPNFRRLFATQSIRQGMNLFHVQSLLGHEDLKMTRVYAEQVNSEDAISAYKRIVT